MNLPSINRLISFNELPQALEFLEGVSILNNLFYKNHIRNGNKSGSFQSHSITLVSETELSINFLGGLGAKLILLPGANTTSTSELRLNLQIGWKLKDLTFLKSIENFSADSQGFLNLFKELYSFGDKLLITGCINSSLLSSSDPVDEFIQRINSNFTPTPLLAKYSGNSPDVYEDLLIQMDNTELSVIEVILSEFVLENSLESTLDNLKELLPDEEGLTKEKLFDFLLPKIQFSIEQIPLAIEFPEGIFKPVDATGTPIQNAKTRLTFNVGSLDWSTVSGFKFEGESSFSFTKSEILNTGFTLEVNQMKLDLSREENIPEAIADDRPEDFIGVYITDGAIGFPSFLNHDDSNSNAELYVNNLLAGTGGISGKVGLRLKSGQSGTPEIKNKIGNFKISLNSFSLTFKQNSVTGSEILGKFTLPDTIKDGSGAPAVLDIKASISENGDFSLSAKEPQGIDFKIPDVLTLRLYSLELGEKNDKFYVKIKGAIKITADPAGFPLMEDFVQVPGIIIWEDGSIEIEGGRIPLPKAFELKLGPSTISITAIDYGTTEKGGRKYSYFGFSGGLDMSPGGVDVQGNGIKYFFTTDGSPFKHFLELDQISVDISLPSHVEPKDANIQIKGFLSISNPESNNSQGGDPSKEYLGSVKFRVRQSKVEFAGGASMRLSPKVPAFVVDAFLEFNSGIPLGNTGLGIYGFKGLVGQRYLPSKTAAGVSEDASWWYYYKKPTIGVGIEKFKQEPGFSVGAGVILGSLPDGGFAFSSKLMLLLGLPDALLLVGQAGVMQERLSFFDSEDPPYYAMLALSKDSVNIGAGAVYKVPQFGTDAGKVLTIYPEIEIAYFFNNPRAWFINFGKEYPAQERIKARILDLFDGYAFIMINADRIRIGAGASYVLNKRYGPIRVKASAYLDARAQLVYKPLQAGGSIALRAMISVKISKFGLSLEAGAGVAAEAPRPFIITGYIYVSVKFPWPIKRKKFNVDFTWKRSTSVDRTPMPPIGIPGQSIPGEENSKGIPVTAVNMLTGETFPVAYSTDTSSGTIPAPSSGVWNTSFGNVIVPLDSFIDIQFERSVSPSLNITNIGGHSFSPQNSVTVPPRKGVSAQVNHRFNVLNVDIKIWDGSTWQDYKVYEACTAIRNIIDTQHPTLPDKANRIAKMKDGYWQLTSGNKIDKLRIACDNVFSYTTQASDGNYEIESFEIGGETIFCGTPTRVEVCKDWDNDTVGTNYGGGGFHNFENLKLSFVGAGGVVQSISGHPFTQSKGIKFSGPSSLELHFTKPVVELDLKLQTTADNVTIEYYDAQDVLVNTENETTTSLSNAVEYPATGISQPVAPIKKAVISYDGGGTGNIDTSVLRFGRRTPSKGNGGWFKGQMSDVILCNAELTATEIQDYFGDPIGKAPSNMVGRWLLDQTPVSDTVSTNHGSSQNTQLINVNGRNCYDFNGVDADIEVPHNNSLSLLGSNFTMMTWINSTQNSLDVMIDKRGSSGYHLYITGGKLGYQIMNDGKYVNRVSNQTTVADGKWHHVAVTHNATTGETNTYVDGALEQTYTETSIVINSGDLHLLECCYLTEEDYQFNISNPVQSKVQEDINAMADAMTLAYQPIWRPYSKFAIHVTAEDIVDGVPRPFHFNFGFQTEGPIGHFPLGHPNFARLAENGKEKQITVASLRHYIDYLHSYPNAEGKLVGEKPVYRDGVKLQLFYTEAYVNSMFSDWDAYQGNGAVSSRLIASVFDPETTGDNKVSLAPDLVINSLDYEKSDKQILKSFRENGVSCTITIPELNSQNISGEYVLPVLKPSKLYTAVFHANVVAPSIEESTEVHRYGFMTSKYKDFDEHIDSYIFDPSLGLAGKAIYATSIVVNNHVEAINVLNETLADTDPLIANYANHYDRLVNGSLKLGNLNAVEDLELNLLIDDNIGLVGVLLRSPEPIWRPKMPLNQTVAPIVVNHNTDASTYKAAYSKDRSSILISNASMDIPSGTLTLALNDYEVDWEVDSGEYKFFTSGQKSIVIDLTNFI